VRPRIFTCFLIALIALSLAACSQAEETALPPAEGQLGGISPEVLRERLVDGLEAQGISDLNVLAAMRKVPRHEFVPENYQEAAYQNNPLPIGLDQTISQPYIVAYMTEVLQLTGGEKVLEIGTGSGYQAAILAEIAAEVYSIEILEPLAKNAEQTLRRLGYTNIHIKAGDGYKGWPEHAPFDAIIVTAAPDHVPQPLVQQLKVGGRMVIPVGEWFQNLLMITKNSGGVTEQVDIPVRFVPMTGEAQQRDKE